MPGGAASFKLGINEYYTCSSGRRTATSNVVPQTRNVINPLVLVAARLSGVEEIYRVGGAQAILWLTVQKQ